MSQRDRALKQHLDLYLEEQRRLHKEVMAASMDARLAAGDAKAAADGMTKAAEDLGKWTLSIQKRVEKLEHWRTGMAAGGLVAGAVLWDKAKKVLGLGS